MANKFDVYINHYALQWLKSMRTGSALLHRWSTVLGEFNFTAHHRPGKAQTHADGLSWLPVEQAPPEGEEATLITQPLVDEAAAHQVARELHSAIHVRTEALW